MGNREWGMGNGEWGMGNRTYAQDQRNRVSGSDFADEIEISRSETWFLRKS